MKPQLLVTLWPSFPHFSRFAYDTRLAGVRLNSAMVSNAELDKELGIIAKLSQRPQPFQPLFFDVKGRQLRITKVETRIVSEKKCLVITLNHPIEVKTPCVVLFKAAADVALLDHLEDNGTKLVFRGGPKMNVHPGESIHIREASFKSHGETFTEVEKEKITKVKAFGFKRYFLSYVENQKDVDEFRELVGQDAEVWLKIENLAGLHYVNHEFKKKDNLTLVAARGDLFVELEKPHHIVQAQRDILAKDPEACVGSRVLLSIIDSPVPDCADIMELAMIKHMGYKRIMLCDELCLKENMLAGAVSTFDNIIGEI